MSDKPSIFEEITIESNDKLRTVDVRLGTISIDYYEDIFSPTITAKLVVTNTGNTVEGKDGEMESIYNGLPLRGGERVSLFVKANSDSNVDLDFRTNADDYLYVSSINNVISEKQTESFVLNLVSRESITNETTRVIRKYPGSSAISASAENILEEVLQTRKTLNIDQSANKYGFIGNLRKPFTVLTWLASKAVPESSKEGSTAGYVFFQTKEGYHFKALDNLIAAKVKDNYYYADQTPDSEKYDVDKQILTYATNRNQNLLEKLRLGAYSSIRMYFDPLTFQFTDPGKQGFTQDQYAGKTKNLGKKLQLPRLSDATDRGLGESPSRIFTGVLDRGTLEPDVKTDTNADPFEYQSQSLMRYNVMFTQSLTMTVPLNTTLNAGDIIGCSFPRRTTSDAKEFDQEQSGLYMIKELCHHFDKDGSYTSMQLIRDTTGLHGKNNEQ